MGQGKFTNSQWQAITTGDCDLLVAAAAGSGKTAVLVERIINMITDETKPVNIDQLLVVTFTKAAATEMKQRIGEALTKRLEINPDNMHLQNQLTLLNRADIKTIHAFCLQVIKEYYFLIDIDPQSRTGDTAEIKLLQQEILDTLFEKYYDTPDNEPFLELVERFGEATGDNKLKNIILQLYYFLLGCPNPTRWLKNSVDELKNIDKNGFENAACMPILMESVRGEAEFAAYFLKTALNLANEFVGFEGYANNLTAELDGTTIFLEALKQGYNEAYKAISALQFARLSPYKGEDKQTAEEIKAYRDMAKKILSKMTEQYFPCPPETSQRHMARLWQVAEALCNLTLEFMDCFNQAKRDKQLLDFGDYEHYCLEILVDQSSTTENVIPTEAAKSISQQYIEILIDEYQDSNIIQEMLLSAVSKKSIHQNNRFMVGDVKQSIYGFRLAAPELFMEKYNSFPSAVDGDDALCKKIVLSNNFRSRANVLEGINFLFCQIMDESFGGITYDKEAALAPAMKFPKSSGLCGGENEILIVDYSGDDDDLYLQDLSRRELEAQLIANRIKALLTEGFLVLDKTTQEYRPAQFGDIVILLRSLTVWDGIFEKIFLQEEIPFFASTSKGYYDTQEVAIALCFLQLIDNPMQDIPLMSVLHNPIYGFSADMLMEIRLAPKPEDKTYTTYFDALEGYIQLCKEGSEEVDQALGRRIESFLNDLTAWREYAEEYSISQLLWYLYDATGYYDYVGVHAGGKLRQANLRLLIEKAEQYEQTSRKGLFYFIKYIQQMKKAEADDAGSAKAAEGGNLVQIMTIHKSKGLEFPIVFVSDLGKEFNQMDIRSPLLMHQKLGLAFDDFDIENRVIFKPLIKSAIAQQIKKQNIAEELRVLYVALTRAKEKLILTASVKDIDKSMDYWLLSAQADTPLLPEFFISRAKGYMDWIMPSYLRHSKATKIWTESSKIRPNLDSQLMGTKSEWLYDYYTKSEVAEGVTIRKKAAITTYDSFAAWDCNNDYSGQKNEIYRRLSWKYPYQEASKLPSKISISEIKRRQYEQDETQSFFPRIYKSKSAKKTELSATEIGIAVHTFLEYLNFNKIYTKSELIEEIDNAKTVGLISTAEAEAIDCGAIAEFFDSPLAKRMANSNIIKKEQPFAITMTPTELGLLNSENIANEQILINGIIDCYFYENGNIILLDYKTDNIHVGQEDVLKKRYALQLTLYKEALERITGAKVTQSYIYSLALSKAILL